MKADVMTVNGVRAVIDRVYTSGTGSDSNGSGRPARREDVAGTSGMPAAGRPINSAHNESSNPLTCGRRPIARIACTRWPFAVAQCAAHCATASASSSQCPRARCPASRAVFESFDSNALCAVVYNACVCVRGKGGEKCAPKLKKPVEKSRLTQKFWQNVFGGSNRSERCLLVTSSLPAPSFTLPRDVSPVFASIEPRKPKREAIPTGIDKSSCC